MVPVPSPTLKIPSRLVAVGSEVGTTLAGGEPEMAIVGINDGKSDGVEDKTLEGELEGARLGRSDLVTLG